MRVPMGAQGVGDTSVCVPKGVSVRGVRKLSVPEVRATDLCPKGAMG